MTSSIRYNGVDQWMCMKRERLQQARISWNIDSFLEEEEAILQHFTFQIFLICGEVDRGDLKLERKRKWRVAATAAYYFRRFFATESVLFHDPRIIMLASIFLSGKVEEHYKLFISLSELRSILKTCHDEDIIHAERSIVEELDFELGAFHPQNCMYSILNHVRKNYGHITSELVSNWINTCSKIILQLLTTKASIMVPPVFLAYWSLHNTAPSGEEKRILESSFRSILTECGSSFDSDHQHYFDMLQEFLNQSNLGENYERMHSFLSKLKPIAKWKLAKESQPPPL